MFSQGFRGLFRWSFEIGHGQHPGKYGGQDPHRIIPPDRWYITGKDRVRNQDRSKTDDDGYGEACKNCDTDFTSSPGAQRDGHVFQILAPRDPFALSLHAPIMRRLLWQIVTMTLSRSLLIGYVVVEIESCITAYSDRWRPTVLRVSHAHVCDHFQSPKFHQH